MSDLPDSNGSSAPTENIISLPNGDKEPDPLAEQEAIMAQNRGEVFGMDWHTTEAKDRYARALRVIHDQGLFAKKYKNFVVYLKERWNLSR
jgi:hypothetical protein